MDETLRQLGELLLGSIPTVVLFVIIWVAYRAIVHSALSRAVSERRDKTVGAVEKAKADIAVAEHKTAEYEQKIREARIAVFRGQESRRQQVLEQKMIAIREARKAAEARLNAARAEIQKETESAKARVEAESSNLAAQIMRAILRTGSTASRPALGGGR
jgi:F-type H+-transporting ATPase subunit b